MVRIEDDRLIFSFPEVHDDAELRVTFQRTLRIPDDDRDYLLPPGLGAFPLVHVDDHSDRVSARWKRHGGVMLPMYQAEAMWLSYSGEYPMAVKVAAGKVNAVTGDAWDQPLHRRPQDYLVTPNQPWLDGFVVGKGVIRQFVAMPLGAGYTAEEQLRGAAEHGGVQIVVYPLKAAVRERMLRAQREAVHSPPTPYGLVDVIACCSPANADMGLGAGGRMTQEIYTDRRKFEDWDTKVSARCFVHLVNAMLWRQVTGEEAPPTPVTASEYARHGLPWFDYYAEGEEAVDAQQKLAGLVSVAGLGKTKGDVPLPENESVDPGHVVKLGPKKVKGQVRDGEF